jgi:hypothetical protein
MCTFRVYEYVPVLLAVSVARLANSWDIGCVTVCVTMSAFIGATTPAGLCTLLSVGHIGVLCFAVLCVASCRKCRSTPLSTHPNIISTEQSNTEEKQAARVAPVPEMLDFQEHQRRMMQSWVKLSGIRRSFTNVRTRLGQSLLDSLCSLALTITVSHIVVLVMAGSAANYTTPLVVDIQRHCDMLTTPASTAVLATDPTLVLYWGLTIGIDVFLVTALHPGTSGTRMLTCMEHATPLVSMIVVPLFSYHALSYL